MSVPPAVPAIPPDPARIVLVIIVALAVLAVFVVLKFLATGALIEGVKRARSNGSIDPATFPEWKRSSPSRPRKMASCCRAVDLRACGVDEAGMMVDAVGHICI